MQILKKYRSSILGIQIFLLLLNAMLILLGFIMAGLVLNQNYVEKDINMVYLTDYSEKLDYYTPVLATNEEMIENDPETVKAFLKAASKGYQFAIDKPR